MGTNEDLDRELPPISVILRYLGSQGISAKVAHVLLADAGLRAAPSTISNQISQGKKHGPPNVSKEEKRQLDAEFGIRTTKKIAEEPRKNSLLAMLKKLCQKAGVKRKQPLAPYLTKPEIEAICAELDARKVVPQTKITSIVDAAVRVLQGKPPMTESEIYQAIDDRKLWPLSPGKPNLSLVQRVQNSKLGFHLRWEIEIKKERSRVIRTKGGMYAANSAVTA